MSLGTMFIVRQGRDGEHLWQLAGKQHGLVLGECDIPTVREYGDRIHQLREHCHLDQSRVGRDELGW